MDIARYEDNVQPDTPCVTCALCGLCVGCMLCGDCGTPDNISWAGGFGLVGTAAW